MPEGLYGISHGLNLDDVDHTSQEEIDTFLMWARRNHAPLYYMTSHTVFLENRPDILKLHQRILPQFRKLAPEAVFVMSLGQLGLYINLDWEIGIVNEFKVLQEQGVTRDQLMETVMAAQVYSGIRSMEGVYRAVWPFIRDFRDRPEPARWPSGWAPDAQAFKAGLDTSTKEMTGADRDALYGWYEHTQGEIPNWVEFMNKHHPDFLKAYRLRWEGTFRGALPKQMMPVHMLYFGIFFDNMGLVREGALLGRSWGLTRGWIVTCLYASAFYYTGLEGLNRVQQAVGDILDSMS